MARWFVDRSAQRGIPSISLRSLLPEARFLGCTDLQVSCCTADSRRLEPGQVFVALSGARHDGHSFVARALERGAAAVVVERPCDEAGLIQVVVPDSRLAHARLCQALAGNPAEETRVIGVAGTQGKTAAGLFIRSIAESAGMRFGLIGPFEWSDGVRCHPSGPADPGPAAMAEMLGAMVENGCEGGIMEISRGALEAREIEAIGFDAAIVTTLGGPPSETVDARRRRRSLAARLFRGIVPGGAAIVNQDDPDAELLGATNLASRRVSFSLEGSGSAAVAARLDRLDATGTKFRLLGFDREAVVHLRPVGRRIVSHALAAAAWAWSRGLDVDAVVAGLEEVACVPGRLESIDEGQGFDLRIDRARTEFELREALADLRSIGAGRIHCVLGSEGMQDRAARLAIGRAVEELADHVVLTSDNPRAEDPDQILDDLLAGMLRPGRVRVISDRRKAIEAALSTAGNGDLVLIAGKGNRAFQILEDRAIPFDDRSVATQWLRRRQPSRNLRSA